MHSRHRHIHCLHSLPLYLLLPLSLLLLLLRPANAARPTTSLRYDFGSATTPSIPRARVDTHRGFPRIPGLADPLSGTFLPASVFSSSISGTRFSVPLRTIPHDIYDLTFAFVQVSGCSTGHHVFDVLLDGVSKLDSYDIFTAAANRCHRPVAVTFARQRLPAVLIFSAVSTSAGSRASIAYLSVTRSAAAWETKCERPVSKHGLPKHLAHAVPGSYKPETDWQGIGYFTIFLDGRQSHSHYAHHGKGKSARLVSFTWTEMNSGRLISRRSSLRHAFPVGVSYVTLMVVDDACNRHVASTSVTVTAAVKPGAYCYFYYLSTAAVSSGRMPAPQTIFSKTLQAPFAAAVARDAPVFDFDSMHPPLRALPRFVARCVFFITVSRRGRADGGGDKTPVSVIVPGGGEKQQQRRKLRARLFQGTRLAVDSASVAARGVRLSPGQTAFELHALAFGGTGGPRRRVSVLVSRQPPKTSYDETSVMPVLTSVSPARASLSGGNVVSVSGYGLYWPLTVYFGNVKAIAEWRGSTSTRLFIKTPRVKSASVLPLSVQSKPDIVSNKLRFNFSDACDSIAFAREQLIPRPTMLKLVTAAVYGNDNRFYLASLTGKVFRLAFDALSLTVRQTCESPVLYDERYRSNVGTLAQRAALGITLDPRDSPPRPYVSLNTLEWPHRITTDNKLRWANGAVDRLVNTDVPGGAAANSKQKKTGSGSDGSHCLAFDKHIVTNLPVSRRDHGVSALLFTQGGDLLISLGGHTNAGLPSHAMGGSWEGYFSSAVLIARLSRGAKFNGEIQYVSNPSSPARARPKRTGDVDLFATGTRNLFSMTMLRDGRVLGVDMGSNCGQGNVSSSCAEYSPRDNREEIAHMNGRVVVDQSDPDAKTCPYGPSRVDKILHVKQNGFYGHPNLQRSRPDECRWVDPVTSRLPPRYAQKAAPRRYIKPFAMVFSAKTGLVQYGASLFCGELRGDVLLSQYSETGTWRLRLGARGTGGPLDEPYQFIHGFSGMAVMESIHGDLIMPRYKHAGVFVAKARTRLETERQKARSLTAINALPFRHGSRGGTVMYIGGFGFKKSGTRVFVGKRPCRVLKSSGREISCVVPPKSGGPMQADVTVMVGKMKSVLPKAVLYMSV